MTVKFGEKNNLTFYFIQGEIMFISVTHLVSGIYSEPWLNGTFNIITYRFAVRL